jgi:putative ABC transport system ATP-binding protein
VLLEGEDVTGMSESRRSQLRLTHLGYVFQEYALIPELTACENVYLPAMMRGASRVQCRQRSCEMLETVGLGDRVNHRPKELSGGEQQRVAIARALVNEPSIVYADEPTANLDSAAGRTVMETLVRLNVQMGVTVVFVSHAPEDRAYASKTITLADGIVESEEYS